MTTESVEAFLVTTGSMIVINLPHRADRRAEFSGQLRRIGLGFDHPKVRIFPAVRPADAGGFPTIGTRGCFLSHLTALREVVATGQGAVLICEDDLDFTADMLARLRDLTAALKGQPWDIFYGGYDAPPLALRSRRGWFGPILRLASAVRISMRSGVLQSAILFAIWTSC